MDILFIDENGIKLMYPQYRNIQTDYFTQSIIDNQLFIIKPLLGEELYEDIQLQLSGNTLTTANKKILDEYLCRILAITVIIDIMYEVVYQIDNNGIRVKTSQNSTQATIEEFDLKAKHLKTKADTLTNEFKRYIYENRVDYPLYYRFESDDVRTSPKKIYGL